MDKFHYEEMLHNLHEIIKNIDTQKAKIVLFGHCNATETLIDVLIDMNINVECILDNNEAKHGNAYRNITIKPPNVILENATEVVVLIVARAYAAMRKQLRCIGYEGPVYKLVEYNSFSEYSLSKDTIDRMTQRLYRGMELLNQLKSRYSGGHIFLCPFSALGDIYIMMSYLPHYLKQHNIENCVIAVVGKSCEAVVKIFGDYSVEVLSQKNMDEIIQASLYTEDKDVFIPHQDRPYVVNISNALYVKKISLEQMYCCGVFGLPINTKAFVPQKLDVYSNLSILKKDRSVILSPYAKSITSLDLAVWNEIVKAYSEQGYICFTNVVGNEREIEGTMPITVPISEIQSVVEYAGTFIGIRSGLCDVLKEARCRKVALYPDYNYCDTHWKSIDIYAIDGWENIVVKDDFKWQIN